MFFWLIAGLLIVGQCHAMSVADPLFVCRAWGDPHLETWHLHGTAATAAERQDCYTNGAYDLVKNSHVEFTIQTNARYIIQSTVALFTPPSINPFCVLHTENSGIVVSNAAACSSNGVTWTTTTSGNQYTLTLEYKQGQEHFKTTIQYVNTTHNAHFNIHVWEPQSWVPSSTGFCTQGDATCSRTRTVDSPQQTFTYTQAYDICQAYINAYLSKSEKRTDLLQGTVDNVMNGCVADVMFTGDAEAASSGVSVLMVEELTGGETSVDALRTAINSGMTGGSMKVQNAVQEARMKVARFH